MQYQIGEFLQKGSFGKIYKDKEQENIAIKAIKKSRLRKTNIDPFLEINILSRLDSEYVIKLHDWCESDKKFFHILEYFPEGDLYDRIRKEHFSQELALVYIKEISKGVQYIHNNEIIHRDLKPENILISGQGKIKIIDFGLAVEFSSSFKDISSVFYAAPELFEKKQCDYRIDIWSIGIMYYEMITGNTPFEGDSYIQIVDNIISKNIKFPENFNTKTVYNIKSILEKCPVVRASIEQILNM